ncbi:uncharacterized protein LOC110105271 [Dendrobium catenatum]|uniref:Uncharacterized protein n=1 Tax=Dendrobium catenatum TaxID=906689 RepID=A0A2I0WLU3_9ASPA|nr:uncharacterized protein LOC110105271 [Dendrobium catenatum]XP_020690360.1 uncharacterized protein LOC110105271 [Dendrobium catenatum]PKU76627.1 hypothetical protein MA16_Dca001232 [Dendrobium catenatum]
MARRSLYQNGGTVCHGQDGSKLADHNSMSHNQSSGYISNPRRSLRLKVAAAYEVESAIPDILSLKHQQETGAHTCVLSPKQVKVESPLYEKSHGPLKQKNNFVDITDSEDESCTSITLMDLLTMCKSKKRKASEGSGQANVDILEHNNDPMMVKEEDPELDEKISSFKIKKAKSSPTSEKLNKYTESTLHSSPPEKNTLQTFPLASVAPMSGLDEAIIEDAISKELSLDSEYGLGLKKESVDAKMKEIAEQSPLSVGTSAASVIKEEVIETCLVMSDDENSMMNSNTVLVNKCDFDKKYIGELLDKVSERVDLEQPENVISNIMDPFLRDIIRQCKHDFSSSSPTLENFQFPSHDVKNVKNEHLVVGSTKCDNTAPNAGLMTMFKHHRNLPTEVIQKEDQQGLQLEELMPSDKRDLHLTLAESSTEFIESDGEKLKCFLENNSWLVKNRRSSFSDTSFIERIVSFVTECKTSYSCDNFDEPTDDSGVSLSLENHDDFVGGLNHDSIDKNNCLGASHSHKSLDVVNDGGCSMVSENSSELMSQSVQPLSSFVLSQIDHSILSNDTLVSVDAPCSITEAGSAYLNPICENGKQASYYDGDSLGGLTRIDADGWVPQTDKLLPSSQAHKLNRCLERKPCGAKVSDLTDAVRPSGQIVCPCPVSQLHETTASTQLLVKDGLSKSAAVMDAIADFPISSCLESSAQICVERLINMQTTEIQMADTKFGGQLCMEVEHSPKKLLSNRKEISPNSQEKLLRALNNGGLDDVVKLSNCMKKLCFDKGAAKKPLSSFLDDGETFLEAERMIKKPKIMNESLPEITKGILKSPDTICCNPCFSKNSSIHDAILFSQRQMQDTENIATKLLKGLNSLKSIVEGTICTEGPTLSPSKLNFDEIRLATKHASKLEVTTKKWLAMMAKDCTRFCKIMRLAENKLVSPVHDLHKGRKKVTFADEAGGPLCQIKVYEQQPVSLIYPKS